MARPPRLARMAGRHAYLRSLVTVIHETSGLRESWEQILESSLQVDMETEGKIA